MIAGILTRLYLPYFVHLNHARRILSGMHLSWTKASLDFMGECWYLMYPCVHPREVIFLILYLQPLHKPPPRGATPRIATVSSVEHPLGIIVS